MTGLGMLRGNFRVALVFSCAKKIGMGPDKCHETYCMFSQQRSVFHGPAGHLSSLGVLHVAAAPPQLESTLVL